MGIKQLVERHWLKPQSAYDPETGWVEIEQSRPLRALLWRDEGRQNQQTGEIVGTRDRWPRIVVLGLSGHWLRHWTHYTNILAALAVAGFGSDAIKSYVENKCVQEEAAEQAHNCPAAVRLLPLDREKDCPVAPLRCE